jgi:hypothetical protein
MNEQAGSRRPRAIKSMMGLLLSWPILISSAQLANAQPSNAEKQWVLPIANWNGRAYYWALSGDNKLLTQPIMIGIASTAAAGGSPHLQLGFKHSGYSGPDEDGKNALLTVSVETESEPLTDSQKSALVSQGYDEDDAVGMQNAGSWTLDVSLASDPVEEARIRQVLGLPITTSAIGTVVPLSVKWSGIDGSKLFDWLTNNNNGLQIIIAADSTITWTISSTVDKNAAKLASWWASNAGASDTLTWVGTVDSLLAQLVEDGVFADSRSSQTMSASQLVPFVPELDKRLQSICQTSGNTTTVTKDELLAKNFNVTIVDKMTIPVRVQSSISPGVILQSRPELVVDLTNGEKGLSVLKGGNPQPATKRGRAK